MPAEGSDKQSSLCKTSGGKKLRERQDQPLPCWSSPGLTPPSCKAASSAIITGSPQLCLNQLQSFTLAVKSLCSSTSFPASSDSSDSSATGGSFLLGCPWCWAPPQNQLYLKSASRCFSQNCPAPFIQLCREKEKRIKTTSNCVLVFSVCMLWKTDNKQCIKNHESDSTDQVSAAPGAKANAAVQRQKTKLRKWMRE